MALGVAVLAAHLMMMVMMKVLKVMTMMMMKVMMVKMVMWPSELQCSLPTW